MSTRALILDEREYEMVVDALAASVEQFEQCARFPGLTCEVRQTMQQAMNGYRALLHKAQAGQLEQGTEGRLL